LVHDKLEPGTRIYVEWSNETWNDIFQQSAWVQAQARQRGRLWTSVVAEEALRDWDIWRAVFQDEPQRVVRVLAGQHGTSTGRDPATGASTEPWPIRGAGGWGTQFRCWHTRGGST
jgi:hypothetical protein